MVYIIVEPVYRNAIYIHGGSTLVQVALLECTHHGPIPTRKIHPTLGWA